MLLNRVDIKANFKPDCLLTVQWDGKILLNITGTGNVDHLPIFVSDGGGVNKLLGVLKLNTGTGEAMASVIVDTLFYWDITEHIKLSFDTTATGHINDALNY